MSDILHGKRITTVSFYEGEVTSSKDEIEVSLFTTREHLLKDIIEALEVISSGTTNKLTVEVMVDTQGRYRLLKKWQA